jgi:non-specific serine/threonine protein kinase/serine/threonine-protein kinase
MKDSSHWIAVRTLFEQVLDRVENVDPGTRSAVEQALAFLDVKAAEDGLPPGVAQEARRLVRAHFADDSPLDSPVRGLDVASVFGEQDWNATSRPEPDPGQRVDKYRIIRALGRGGMGTVFLAERDDGHYSQQVALKLVGLGSPGDDLPERLRAERQILAGLNHPNIARLLDGGPSEWGPFLAMEYVDGQSIDTYCNEAACDLESRLALFLTACEAIQYSHSNLIVHRDLKPAHILITSEGRVKLLDFGVAALVDPSTANSGIQSRATPRFAAPEQLSGLPVTTAADIHALGKILALLIEGVSLRSALKSDLKAIVAKATRSEATDRYDTVDRLASDIRRSLESRPILASRPGPVERSRKFLRRHRIPVGVGTALVLLLSLGMWATWNQARIAEERFDQVRALSNAMLSDLHDSIRDLPGATSARQLLAQRAVAYLDTLSATGRDDIESELALGYEQVGEIQGNPHYMNLGDLAAAMQSYQHALDIRRRVYEEDTTNVRARVALAETMGQTAVLTSWNEDNAGAIDLSLDALSLLNSIPESVVGVDPVRLAHVTGRIESELGWWLIWDGRATEGLSELAQSTRVLENLIENNPDAIDIRLDLWRAYSYEVDGLRFTGRTQSALTLVEQEGLPLLESTLALAALHPRTLYGLHVAHDYIGVLESNLGRHEAAADAHAISLTYAQTLVETDPRNQKAHEAMARTQTSRGNVLARLGRMNEALDAFRSSNTIRERLFEENPLNASLGNTAATGHRVLCRTLLDMNMPVDAIASCQHAIDIQQRVVSVSKGSPILISNLGSTYAYMARATRDLAVVVSGLESDSLRAEADAWYSRSISTLDTIASVMDGYVFEIHPDTLRAERRMLAAARR